MYLLILILILYIKTQDTEEKVSCSLNTVCSDCEFCQDYSNCNFFNIFCYQNNSGDYMRNEDLQNNLSLYYKNDRDINSFCNSRSITLNKAQKSFNIFESPSNTLNNIFTKSFHCEYYVTNKYYLEHNTDQAKINIELKNSEKSQIKFFIMFIYKTGNSWRFFRYNDTQIRNSSFTRVLDKISEFQILLDFFSLDTTEEINEYLSLSISTDNPSEKMKVIYIVIIVILCFFLLLVIALVILYYYLRRKMILEQERRIEEQEEKNREQKRLVEDFLKNDLKKEIFNERTKINDCDSCTICCEDFIVGQSEVSITPCFHVFHYDCIYKWIKEKINNPCCPNCNFQFTEYMKNPVKIEVKRREKSSNELISKEDNKIDNNDRNVKVNVGNEINENNSNLLNSEQIRIKNQTKEENNDNVNDNDNSIHISEEDNKE
jgi:hypothetical protein